MLKKTLFAILLIILLFFLYISASLKAPAATSTKEVSFTVAKGQGAMIIADNLKEKELIRNSTIFYAYAKYAGAASKIQAGGYILSPDMKASEVLDILTGGKAVSQNLTVRIKEGSTLEDVAIEWAEEHPDNANAKTEFLTAANSEAKKFDFFGEKPTIVSLEGYLFPDTYFVSKNAGPEVLIQKMLETLDLKLTAKLRADIKGRGQSIYETLTMASIIEKEVGRNTSTVSASDVQNIEVERKIVSGIFYNRLGIGMALQSDATVTYLTKKRNPSASYADLQIDSPYNTYMYKGLPPGPISNPSISAIEAAIYPTDSDYIYFLTKPDGTAVFAKTHDEHVANKNKYLK